MSEEVSLGRWQHTCKKCGYTWISKIQNPGSCANTKCRRLDWRKPRQGKK